MSTHRPLIGIFILYAAGIILSRYIPILFLPVAAAAGLLILFGMIFLRSKIFSRIVLFLCIVAIGSAAGKNAQMISDLNLIRLEHLFRKRPALVEGAVVSDVQKRAFFKGKKTVFILDVRRVKVGWEDPDGKPDFIGKRWKMKQGRVLVNAFGDFPVQYGDHIQVQGKLHRPFDFSTDSPFSYEEYLNQRGIKLILSVKKNAPLKILGNHGKLFRRTLLKWKNKVKTIFNTYLPPVTAGMLTALIIGDRYDISKQLKELFVQTGTAHILAISGFNVGIMAFVVFLILKVSRVPRSAQFVLTICFLIFYCLFTGGQAPVVRSTIMSIIFLSSFIVERETEALNSWALAGLILLMTNPLQLFDIGFQLSFLSVLFMIIFCPKISQWLKNRWPEMHPAVQYVLQSFSISLIAWLGVSGLIAYYFRIFTPITVLANFFIVPLSSLNIALGLGLIASGLFCPGIAVLFVKCIDLSLHLMIWIEYFLAQVPGAYFYLDNFPLKMVGLYYFLLVFILIVFHKRRIIQSWIYGLGQKTQAGLYVMKIRLSRIDKKS